MYSNSIALLLIAPYDGAATPVHAGDRFVGVYGAPLKTTITLTVAVLALAIALLGLAALPAPADELSYISPAEIARGQGTTTYADLLKEVIPDLHEDGTFWTGHMPDGIGHIDGSGDTGELPDPM